MSNELLINSQLPINRTPHERSGFTREIISDEDRKKYSINEVDLKYSPFKNKEETRWVIDHDRRIYLRYKCDGGYTYPAYLDKEFFFFWGGVLFTIRLTAKYYRTNMRSGHTQWSFDARTQKNGLMLPPALRGQQQDVLDDLKKAIYVYDQTLIAEFDPHYKKTTSFTF